MIKLLVFYICILFLNPTNNILAQESKISQSEFENIKASIKKLEDSLSRKSRSDSLATSKLMERVDSLRNEIVQEREKVSGVEGLVTDSSNTATTGAIVILFGLLLELIGATFVSGNIFMEKIERIYEGNLKFKYVDLALTNPEREKTYKFIGIFGALLLVIGFVFQFAGTALILNMTFGLKLLLISISIVFCFCLIWYLSGKSDDQGKKEKFKFLLLNLYTFFLKKHIEKLFSFKKNILCDSCLKPVNINIAEIWWTWEENSTKYPYLYVPYDFAAGHKNCLNELKSFTRMERERNVKVHKYSIQDFVQTEYQKLKNWYKEYYINLNMNRSECIKEDFEPFESYFNKFNKYY